MRVLRFVLVAMIVVNFAIAAAAWPTLPERIPIHFDAAGNADGWAARSVWTWFALPALGAVIGVGVGMVLPALTMRMARVNSPWLNVPDKKAFSALSTAARERVIASSMAWLVAIAIAAQAVLGFVAFGSAKVAVGAWSRLSPWPAWCLIGSILVCAVGLVIASHRAVRRETTADPGASA